ncbi:chorismate mutase [Buchnera aphidicola]|uniref:chorismate mutase n=1 Tax=Buchnera aphidicola TaxID=9 RepID=UPI003463A0C1
MHSNNILLNLRNKINKIDESILHLLSKRKEIVIQIAKIKILHNLPIKDKNRERELLNTLITFGKTYNISKNYICNIFKMIIQDSILTQTNIKDKLNKKKYDI